MTARYVEARVAAQGKVNLLLRILAREDNGYHQIETLFQRIALSDSVMVRLTTGPKHLDVIGASPEAVGPTERNLAWRAAQAYQDITGFPAGFEISIEKRIPIGSGLGGGSADAGAVLRALNALNPSALPAEALLGAASRLGADVPFLTQDQSTLAFGWGRGDRLLLLPPLPSSPAWLLVPPTSVATADAYRWVDESARPRASAAVSVNALTSWATVSAIAANDFEDTVVARVPVIGRLLAALRTPEVRGLLGPSSIVGMSGSGSAIVVVAGEQPERVQGAPPLVSGIQILETSTSTFVEPVVLTH